MAETKDDERAPSWHGIDLKLEWASLKMLFPSMDPAERELRAAELRAVVDAVSPVAVVGIFIAFFMVAAFAGRAPTMPLIVFATMVAIGLGNPLFERRRATVSNLISSESGRELKARRRNMIAAIMVAAIGWSGLLLTASSIPEAPLISLFIPVIVGLAAVGSALYASMPQAALAFIVIQLSTLEIVILRSPEAVSAFFHPLVIIFGITLARSALHQCRMLAEAVGNAGRLVQAERVRADFTEASLAAERARAEAAAEAERATRQAAEAELSAGRTAERSRDDEKRRALLAFETSIGDIAEGIDAASATVASGARALSDLVSQSSVETGEINDAAEGASQAAENIVVAAEQLAALSADLDERAGRQSAINARVADSLSSGAEAMSALSARVAGIEQIVSTVAGFAAQTNLLALNATIEAARAGSAGRGFAVVADEVKLLAGKVGAAAADVGDRLTAIGDGTGSLAAEFATLEVDVAAMTSLAADMAASVSQQRSAAAEIGTSARGAADHVGRVSARLSTAVDRAREAEALTTEATETATKLVERSQDLAAASQAYKTDLRAA
ncbi:MAG: methyl-accepting chemotaxis protein [Pacificimonas sp.]